MYINLWTSLDTQSSGEFMRFIILRYTKDYDVITQRQTGPCCLYRQCIFKKYGIIFGSISGYEYGLFTWSTPIKHDGVTSVEVTDWRLKSIMIFSDIIIMTSFNFILLRNRQTWSLTEFNYFDKLQVFFSVTFCNDVDPKTWSYVNPKPWLFILAIDFILWKN